MIDFTADYCKKSKAAVNVDHVHECMIDLTADYCKKSPEVVFVKEKLFKDKLNEMDLPNKHCKFDSVGYDCVDNSSKFPVNAQQKKLYEVVCLLASSRHAKTVIVDIGGCTLKCFALGDSLASGHEVCSYVINCICRKFFLDERPTISLKHYFFSCVSEVFMSDSKDYSYVGNCFRRASTVLPLPRCVMLFFLVLYGDHWFLFVVDLPNKLFVFLDSIFSKEDKFSIHTRKKLIVSFCHAWKLFVGTDSGFSSFRIGYPHVPKQTNKVDCGVFLIKFMEKWQLGCKMIEKFCQDDIPNIRIQIAHDLLMSKHNKSDLSVISNFNHTLGHPS